MSVSSSIAGVCRCWARTPFSPRCRRCSLEAMRLWAEEHHHRRGARHEAAVSIDRFLNGEAVTVRPAPLTQLMSQKMGITSGVTTTMCRSTRASRCHGQGRAGAGQHPRRGGTGLRRRTAFKEASRCLNCDVQTVFNRDTCIECDACVESARWTASPSTTNGEEATCAHVKGRRAIWRRRCSRPPSSRPGASWSRTRTCACTAAVCRALPHRRVGHAEIMLNTTQAGASCRDA